MTIVYDIMKKIGDDVMNQELNIILCLLIIELLIIASGIALNIYKFYDDIIEQNLYVKFHSNELHNIFKSHILATLFAYLYIIAAPFVEILKNEYLNIFMILLFYFLNFYLLSYQNKKGYVSSSDDISGARLFFSSLYFPIFFLAIYIIKYYYVFKYKRNIYSYNVNNLKQSLFNIYAMIILTVITFIIKRITIDVDYMILINSILILIFSSIYPLLSSKLINFFVKNGKYD